MFSTRILCSRAQNKGEKRLIVFISKHIKKGVYIFFACLVVGIVLAVKRDKTATAGDPVICLLKQWKDNLITSSVCIWGFTLSCAIFLFSHLDTVYYGTSLKRIIMICFDKLAVILYVLLYICLLPAIYLTYYRRMWFLNLSLHIINYVYAVGLIILILAFCSRDLVIEIIRVKTVRHLRKRKYDLYPYMDEQLAVLNMIRGMDYDDTWQCNRLKSIMVDMILTAMNKDRVYAIYNATHLLVQQAGYSTKRKRRRIVSILSDICADFMKKANEQGIERDRIIEAVLGVASPMLEVDLTEKEGVWIADLIGTLPWSLQKQTVLGLLFVAEYLYKCDVYYPATIEELLDKYETCNPSCEILRMEENYIRECWIDLNIYNHQGMQSEQLYEDFINDYVNINTRLCTTKILLDLQMRKLSR